MAGGFVAIRLLAAVLRFTWLPGERVSDRHTLPLPADLPPGEYRLIAGLYELPGGERLTTGAGQDAVQIASINLPLSPTAE